MGVTYKLKEEVLQYIIQRKSDEPKLSCQVISDEILDRFKAKVSKSSVHEALKHAGIIIPRERKAKPSFALPADVKSKIQQDISTVSGKLIPPPDNALGLIPDVVETPPPEHKESSLSENTGFLGETEPDSLEVKKVEMNPFVETPSGAQEIASDLSHGEHDPSLEGHKGNDSVEVSALEGTQASFSPVLKEEKITRSAPFPQAGEIVIQALLEEMGLNGREQFCVAMTENFPTFLVGALKVVFKNGDVFFICPQKSAVARDFTFLPQRFRFLPRMVLEACDTLVNNIKPLIINSLEEDEVFKALAKAIKEPGLLASVGIVDREGKDLVSFGDCVAMERKVICSGQIFPAIDFSKFSRDVNNIESMAYEIFGEGLTEQDFVFWLHRDGFFLTSSEGEVLNIIVPNGYEKIDSVSRLCEQITSLRISGKNQLHLTVKALFEEQN